MSDSNSLLLNAHEAMIKAGVDIGTVYQRIGIDPMPLLQPGIRIPHQAQAVFWAAVEAVSGDPEIGLHLCPFISPLAGEILNSLFVYSANVRAGVELFLRHLQLASDHIFLKMQEDDDSDLVQIAGRFGEEGTPRHTEIILLYTCMQMLRLASAGKFKPQYLELHCAPGSNPDEFEKAFGCPIAFAQPECRLHFHRDMLSIPLFHADPDLQKMQQVVAQRRMRQVLLQRVVEEVRVVISAILSNGAPTLSIVAEHLGRSERTLRAELQDAGTSFNQVLSDVQQVMAKRLLATTALPAEQVGHHVGFAERSAFYRAFKRWTGMTPSKYRQRRQAGD